MKKPFTTKGIQAMCFARLEAASRNSDRIMPEHLWLGILRDFFTGEPIHVQPRVLNFAVAILERFEVSTVKLRRKIEDELGETWIPTEILATTLEMDAQSYVVVEKAEQEADRMAEEYVGLHHILCGLLQDASGKRLAVIPLEDVREYLRPFGGPCDI